MNKAAEKTPLLFLFFIILFLVSVEVRAGGDDLLGTSGFYKPFVDTSMPARMILAHNKRLLTGTTIGSALSSSHNRRARDLYIKAVNLHKEAVKTYEKGQEQLAKELAFQSIRAIYESDRQHYNLPEH